MLRNRIKLLLAHIRPLMQANCQQNYNLASSPIVVRKPVTAANAARGMRTAHACHAFGTSQKQARPSLCAPQVCLDAPPNIQVLGCQHVLCAPCAKDLCMRHCVAPALCPMCRIVISGFRVAAVKAS